MIIRPQTVKFFNIIFNILITIAGNILNTMDQTADPCQV